MRVMFTLDLTENEHSIVQGYMQRVCDRLGAKLTYEKLEPHIPMKRRVVIMSDDEDVIFMLDAIAHCDRPAELSFNDEDVLCFMCENERGVFQTGIDFETNKPLLRCHECFKPLADARFVIDPLEHKKDEDLRNE